MAKTNYDAINFRNKDVDKFATKFNKVDPETKAKQDEIRTKGMTENQINLYNQKSEFGKKRYAKGVAKDNVKAEENAKKPAPAPKVELTPEQQLAKSKQRSENVGTFVGAIGNAAAPIVKEVVGGRVAMRSQQQNP